MYTTRVLSHVLPQKSALSQNSEGAVSDICSYILDFYKSFNYLGFALKHHSSD